LSSGWLGHSQMPPEMIVTGVLLVEAQVTLMVPFLT
jgi:hypothetical protein